MFLKEAITSLINRLHGPFRSLIPAETFRYGVTGGLNTAFDILLYFVFYNYVLRKQVVHLGFIAISPHIAAFMFVFPITFATGFWLAKHITFTGSVLRGRVQLMRYAMTVAGSIALNYILLKIFVEHMHFWPTIAKIATTVVVVAYSYLAQRFFTFKTGKVGGRKRERSLEL